MRYLTLSAAASLAAIAAYISVSGLSKIFVGIFIPFAALEACKIVGVLYLHAHWNNVNKVLKTYLCIALGILMVLTSTGIYGYLSSAALVHTNASQSQLSKLEFVDNQITTIESRRKELIADRSRLDGYVDSVSKGDKGSVGVSLHNKQKVQRNSIDGEIKTIDKDIQKLRQERLSVEGENRQVQAEVGPAVYLAKTFYGDSSIGSIEGAIRIVIYLIVFVFDPLAAVLLMASQSLFTARKEEVAIMSPPAPLKAVEDPIEAINEPMVQSEPEPTKEVVVEQVDKPDSGYRNIIMQKI
jgi:hypothetical protein